MADNSTVAKVRGLAQPLCDELGLFLWDVRFEKEGATWYLRIIIDKDGGIDMNDCESLHRPLNKLLDETDPIPQYYVFEVSSPGLARPLTRPEHFEVCIGDELKIKFFKARNGEKEIIRVLTDYQDGQITVADTEGNEEVLPLSECASVKLNDDAQLFG